MSNPFTIDTLPKVKGIYTFDAPLAPLTTLKIGGCADVLFEPASFDDLANFLKHKNEDTPVTLLGEGSNMLVRDGGIAGVVIYLGKGTDNVILDGHKIYAEAGAKSGKVARTAREAALTGVAFLCGIPGSIGGALKMNAGAYGQETADTLASVNVITDKGERKTLQPEELNFSYRHSDLPKGWIYEGAIFVLTPGDKEEIRAQMRQINRDRSTSQPLNKPSSGSWFKNPTLPNGEKTNAWKVVAEAGCRGWQVGQAQVSEKHSNFFVNLGGATASDILELTVKVQKEVKAKFGVDLVQEVRVIGRD